MTKGIRHAVYGSPVYRLSLMGPTPKELKFVPADPWPGQTGRAEAFFHGNYVFGGEEVRSPNRPPWMPAGVSESVGEGGDRRDARRIRVGVGDVPVHISGRKGGVPRVVERHHRIHCPAVDTEVTVGCRRRWWLCWEILERW